MATDKLSIKNWAIDDRPREKLLGKGASALTDAELLAILIGSGSQTETAVQLSQRILTKANNNLHQLGNISISELIKSFKGIGEAKAITIVAALELGRRRKASDILQRAQITGSQQAAELFMSLMGDLPHEEFWVLYLNHANRILHKQRIAQGGISATTVDIRLIFRTALEKNATAIIVSHNHPTGNLQASPADMQLTERIVHAGRLFDIRCLDHIIVSHNRYLSLADEGQLPH